MGNLRQRVKDIAVEVAGDIQHGECFYDKEMLDTFIGNLEELKRLSLAYYAENKEEEC